MRGISATFRSAFTLIELLVVVAIIALLISILLPSLSAAREQARAAKCGSHLRGFGAGLSIYAQENKDWIPGVNTTGFVIRQYEQMFNKNILRLPEMPAQSFDWISPLLRMETTDLGGNRAERFALIQERFRCPSQSTVNSIIFEPPPDAEDFNKIGNWTAISYLMPAAFQAYGSGWDSNTAIGNHKARDVVKAWIWPASYEANTRKYLPKLNHVGQPARKLAVADGTRYLTEDDVLDHDVSPSPKWFGSFTDGGALWAGSIAYGVAQNSSNWSGQRVTVGSKSQGRNMPLSYRHGSVDRNRVARSALDNSGMINAVFFDGHVARLSDRQSRNIEFWYPSGSVAAANVRTEGMEFVEEGFVLP